MYYIQIDTVRILSPDSIQDWWIELSKSLIVAIPVIAVTLIIWQINVYARKKRDKHRIISRYSPLLSKYANFFHNIERIELQFQLAGVYFKTSTIPTDKSFWKKNLTITRNSIDKLQLKWLDVASELAELSNILQLYMNAEQSKEMNKMLQDLSKTDRRQFVEDFENITDLSVGKKLAKDLLRKITDESETIGVIKKTQDISDFLQDILRKQKRNKFNYKSCCYCCYYYIVEWLMG